MLSSRSTIVAMNLLNSQNSSQQFSDSMSPKNAHSIQKNFGAIKEDEESELKSEIALDD